MACVDRVRTERRFWNLLVWGSCVAITVGCAGAASSSMPPFGAGLPTVPATPEIRTLEHRMHELVNRDRKKNNLPALAYDERLADAARAHSDDMRQHHFFDHDSPTYGKLDQRLTRAGYLFVTSRENLAEAPDIDDAQAGLLKSPHHYENLMATDITTVGIGIVRGGPNDPRNLAVTQIFATPGKSESPSDALIHIASKIRAARAQVGLGDVPRQSALDALAKQHLDDMVDELTESNLRPVAKAIAESLAKRPIANVGRVSVGGQVVVDSSQFQAQGAILQPSARGFGIATKHGKDPNGAKRLKVLLLVGM